MLEKIGEPAPPKGLALKLFRAPIWFYRSRLGFLLGERFMLLKHRGRKSGLLRDTVIEIIDQDKERGKIYAASGFGESSQWYKNICADKRVLLTIKNKEFSALARVLDPQGSERVLKTYARVHPRSIKGVAKLSGYRMDGSESDIIAFSRIVKIIEFSKVET